MLTLDADVFVAAEIRVPVPPTPPHASQRIDREAGDLHLSVIAIQELEIGVSLPVATKAPVHGMVVATRNIVDFEPMGVSPLNPWTHS